jgi:O-antigen biosynthesis protein
MRVAFLVHSLGLSGGVGVVVEHVRRLRTSHAIDAEIVLTRPERSADWPYQGLDELPVRQLGDAAAERWDVAVGTWWETVAVLHHLVAQRYAYFVQSKEDRFYDPGDPARMAAALTYELPLRRITEARWIAEQLSGRSPADRTFYVRNGVDKQIFAPPAEPPVRSTGPLRILVEGSPALERKGVGRALAAVAGMEAEHELTLISPDPQAPSSSLARRVLGPLRQDEMADEYRRCDVVLKLSRVEGMFGPPLEGFHLGATCVVTPVTGHEEFVADGWNGLVVPWDDERGTARVLDLLARDRRYLLFLRTNALATARTWPCWSHSSAVMALVLRQITKEPSPDPTGSAEGLAAMSRMAMEFHAAQMRDYQRLQTRMARMEAAFSRSPMLRMVRKVAGRALLGRRR